jgi:hypothetical protein
MRILAMPHSKSMVAGAGAREGMQRRRCHVLELKV